jgi:predicted sulfurtransferase
MMGDRTDTKPSPHGDKAVKREISSANRQYIILFYRYSPLHPDAAVTNEYRLALLELCIALELQGRILVGHSPTEGINGTLAGNRFDLQAFCCALLGEDWSDENRHRGGIETSHPTGTQEPTKDLAKIVSQFRRVSREFFLKIGEPELLLQSPDDFKWSFADDGEVFPDLHIKLVPELIGTGGAFAQISIDETSTGYLTPNQWHEELMKLTKKDNGDVIDEADSDTVVIDCRNTKEFSIGNFEGAIDPGTTTFAQFPRWVQKHEPILSNKRVLMYCTGGIRCEKVGFGYRFSAETGDRGSFLSHQHLPRGFESIIFEGIRLHSAARSVCERSKTFKRWHSQISRIIRRR